MTLCSHGQVLPELWRREGRTFDQLLSGASDGAAAAIASCERYDQQLVDKLCATYYSATQEDSI